MPETIHDVEIFRTGRHMAADGGEADWSEADLDRLASAYDPAYHEAPVVVGHPETNGPAWGWVRALRRVGDRLVATLDLVPEFADILRRGLFRKRSVSLYRDLDGRGPYLRHVGFLGAVPPSVKALADAAFSEGGDRITFEFNEKENPMSWKEKVKNLFTQAVDAMPERDTGPGCGGGGTEAEAEAARKEAERRGAVRARIDALVSKGVVLPAWTAAGLSEFAESLPDGASNVLDFGEGAGKKSPSAWFLDFLEVLPASVPLGETATRRNDPGTGTAARRLGDLVRKKLEAEAGMGYAVAFCEVQRENPDLAAEYAAEVHGR